MFSRIVLFLATNFAILLLLSVVMKVLGAAGILDLGGAYMPLLVMSAVFGFGGAFISLALSKWMAKRATRARVITQPANATERWLLETVTAQARRAGILTPEVAVYDAPDMNAFATGMRRNNALVAVSTGLLSRMDRKEVEAVLAHEVSHVANGDMVTLTLIQGVLNTFVFFFARLAARAIDTWLRGDRQGGGLGFMGYWLVTIAAEIVFGLFATMIVMWFSRFREFRADAGAAKLAGRDAMIGALERLRSGQSEAQLPTNMRAFGIRGGAAAKLFSSHPPLEKRIAALRNA